MELKKESVLIFGTGNIAGQIVGDVAQKYHIVGFLDNSIEKQNRYCGFGPWKVYAPEEHGKLQFDKVILASMDYAAAMYTQLLKLGIREHVFSYAD